MLISNAFALGMLPGHLTSGAIRFEAITAARAAEIVRENPDTESAIGHEPTARIISGLLGMGIPASRVTVSLDLGESMIVAQYRGPRLPEGAVTLPEGAEIQFYFLEVAPQNSRD